MRTLGRIVTFAALAATVPVRVDAQSDAPIGVRAAGMGGAFVAVADDASAVFWNPAGLASGSYFTLVLDRNAVKTAEDATDPRSRSGVCVALGTPPLGVSYYRTRTTRVTTPVAIAEATGGRNTTGAVVVLESLVAHHAGVTLVQSIGRGLAVGATLRFVRGLAAAGVPVTNDVSLDAEDLIGRASNKFDADVGVMASTGTVKAGISVRNLFEPSFAVAGGGAPITLERRVRAGVAFVLPQSVTVAADVDLTEVATSGGAWRDAAVGGEARLSPRAWARAGVHWNTAGDPRPGAAPIGSLGGTYAVYRSMLADGQVSFGSRNGDRGWGLGARIVF